MQTHVIGLAGRREGAAAHRARPEICDSGNARKSGKQLKKTVRKLIQFAHRLRSNKARKTVDESVREPLAETADEIQEDARELRETLACG
jgi:hypothetical protein